jgi:serine/threonine protein kinase
VSLRASLENEIQRTERLNKQRARGGFLSIGFIRDTLTIEKIKEQLKEVPAPLEYLGLEKNNLPHLIRDQASKLYTILLLLNESQRIKGLMRRKPPINDDFLFRSLGKRYASQPCSLERLQGVTELSDIARDFYEKQWIIPPSLLSHETRIFDTQHFRFPFASVPQRLGSGTFGEVYAVKLPKGYLEPFGGTSSVGDTNTVSNQVCLPCNTQIFFNVYQNTSVAYKRIRREDMSDKEWSQTKREVLVLRARRGEHITPLLGSFFAGMHDSSNAEHQCLYLLSPEAKMDMKTWMETPEKNWSPKDIRDHIYCEAMPGLISGLTWIHREMNHQVGYHRDIKPSNILLFENDEKERVWKICDFGSSNIKEVDYTGTTNRITSWEWAPPEFFTDDDTKDGFKHGRTHDVYSMGCVFLCLATILRFGWNAEGLSQFKKNRIIIQDDYVDPQDMSYAHSFHKSEKATQEWIKYLQDKRRDDVDSEVLELIVEMLLPKHERIFSWEVEIDLFIILNPDNHPEEVTERLRKIVQKSMGTNLRTHNPFVRAQQRAHLEEKPPKKRSPEYFEVLAENGWQEYVPQSTTDGRQSAEPVQNPLSNFSPSEHRVGDIYGGQSLYRSISAGFAKSDTVVLYGLAGIG